MNYFHTECRKFDPRSAYIGPSYQLYDTGDAETTLSIKFTELWYLLNVAYGRNIFGNLENSMDNNIWYLVRILINRSH